MENDCSRSSKVIDFDMRLPISDSNINIASILHCFGDTARAENRQFVPTTFNALAEDNHLEFCNVRGMAKSRPSNGEVIVLIQLHTDSRETAKSTKLLQHLHTIPVACYV